MFGTAKEKWFIRNKMKIVIGGSGYIGSNLCEHFSKKGELLAGTYYHNKKDGLEYFDLVNPDLRKLDVDLNRAGEVFICSAISNLDKCKADEKESYKVNVEGSKRLIEQCFNFGLFPIFLSSDNVFNGQRGNYSEEDETNPCAVYGTHKKIIEDFLLKSGENFLIARLSKIFGLEQGDKTLLTSWLEKLRKNEEIVCATDQKLSFTYINDLTDILDVMIEKNLRGCYNTASPESFSRYELANMLKEQLRVRTGRIIPCSIRDLNLLEVRTLDTSLNVGKLQRDTEFQFTPIRSCIKKLR